MTLTVDVYLRLDPNPIRVNIHEFSSIDAMFDKKDIARIEVIERNN